MGKVELILKWDCEEGALIFAVDTRSIFAVKMRQASGSPDYRKLLQYLIKARVAAGLTQQQLAVLVDRQQSFVAKYELGERRLDVLDYVRVSHALALDAGAGLSELFPLTQPLSSDAS